MAPLTVLLARYAVSTRFEQLPEAVRHESRRALLNWLGVAIAGSREPAAMIAAASIAAEGGHGSATMIGHDKGADPASAAFVNCIASSVLAFDDAHLASVAHPSGPAIAALLALAETRPIDGRDFLNAIALGIELQCRIASMLVLPPSTFHSSIYVNGFSGPIGVAAAIGRALRLDEERMVWALGLAASQASGFRSTHGTMTAHFRPGHAARAGMSAAFLAAAGFDCTDNALEAPGGLLDIFAPGADTEHALSGLGQRHEMLANRYKPYPCGIVIHPVIDACLEISGKLQGAAPIEKVELYVHPLVPRLTGKRNPATALESHVSVFHWAAAALLYGTAGLGETQPGRLNDPAIHTLRDRIVANADAGISKGEARAEITLADDTRFTACVTHARGSLERPLSDVELRAKFDALASTRLSPDAARRLAEACRTVADAEDAGKCLSPRLPRSADAI